MRADLADSNVKDGAIKRALGRTPLLRRCAPSLRDKLRRAIWSAVWLCLFLPSPTPLHCWRCWLVRWFGGIVGRRVAIYPTVKIWAPWNLHIDDNATIGGSANLYCVDRISIGAGAIISQGAFLCTASHDFQSRDFCLVTAEVRVCSNVWVAAEAFVGPGVCIGEGAVVGARCVLTRNVGESTVIAGNPARVIGLRDADAFNFLK